jgi:hypothetical protein
MYTAGKKWSRQEEHPSVGIHAGKRNRLIQKEQKEQGVQDKHQ